MRSPSRTAATPPTSLVTRLVTGLVTILALAGCAGSAGIAAQGAASASNAPAQPATSPATSLASGPPSPSPSPSPSPGTTAPVPVAPGAGPRRQTMARPHSSGPAFHAMLADLWLAVRSGRPRLGLPAFFPVDAYKQVKAIYDPAADWRGRLWLDFALDVRAAHALLGRHPDRARFVRAIVPSAEASWVGPGACYNDVGYWHLGNARVVYRIGGQVRSFGIASLISWRGVWYVVHFGGVVRGAVGMVDAPADGPGYAGPPGGC